MDDAKILELTGYYASLVHMLTVYSVGDVQGMDAGINRRTGITLFNSAEKEFFISLRRKICLIGLHFSLLHTKDVSIG